MKALDEIKARLERASPGPWKYDDGNGQIETEEWRVVICERFGNYERRQDVVGMYGENIPNEVEALLKFDSWDDMEFIAHARTDMERLVRVIERYDLYAECSAKPPELGALRIEVAAILEGKE